MFSRLRAYIRKQTAAAAPARRTPLPQHSALVDSNTRTVFAISDNVAAISFLNGIYMDTFHMLNVTWPNYTYALPFSTRADSFVDWTWNVGDRRFVPTRPDVITPEMLAQSKLAMRKLYAVIHIMHVLSVARSRIAGGIVLQETVYMTKKIQAHAFRDAGYDETTIFSYPYVMQYADHADISFRESADDIILKAKLDDDMLAKTELLRLDYFERLRKIEDASEIKPLLESFTRESFTNSYV